MSLLLTHSISDTIAMIRGETVAPWRPTRFDTPNLNVVRVRGIEPAPGCQASDSDSSWNSIVRSWWSLGAAWGLCLSGEHDEVAWNLALQHGLESADAAIPAHLEGARLQTGAPFSHLAGRLRTLPFQAAMAGHPGLDETARLEPLLRAMQGRDCRLSAHGSAPTFSCRAKVAGCRPENARRSCVRVFGNIRLWLLGP